MTTTLSNMTAKKKLGPSAEEVAARELVRLTKEQGLSLNGPDGLLKQFTRSVLETALNEEMTEHLGHEKNRVPAGRESTNIRNGTRPKTVLTHASGEVELKRPRFDASQVIGQDPARPVRHTQLLRRRLQRRRHHRNLVALRLAARIGPILHPGDPLGRIALLPRDQRRLEHLNPLHDLVRPTPSSASSTIRARCARPATNNRVRVQQLNYARSSAGICTGHSQRHTPPS
jgi:Transposase, Mutator family